MRINAFCTSSEANEIIKEISEFANLIMEQYEDESSPFYAAEELLNIIEVLSEADLEMVFYETEGGEERIEKALSLYEKAKEMYNDFLKKQKGENIAFGE